MPSRYNLPHIDITAFVSTNEYVGEGGGRPSAVRERVTHGRRIQHELHIALDAADRTKPTDTRLEAPDGTFLEVELRPGTAPNVLDMKTQHIRSGAAKTTETRDR